MAAVNEKATGSWIVPELSDLWALAIPLILAQLAQVGMNLVDTLVAGRLGPEPLAGIALGSTVFTFVLFGGMGVVQGAGPFVAQADGAGDRGEAGRAARQSLWLAVLVGVVGVVLLVAATVGLGALGQEPAVTRQARRYLVAALAGFPAAMLFTSARSFLEGIGDVRPVMVALVLGNVANLGLNVGLVFGRWGLPALGLTGTGIATATVYVAMAVGLLAYVATRRSAYGVLRGLRRPDAAMLRALARVGWPIGLTSLFESGLFAVTAILMGLFGAVALAAHQVAAQTAAFTFMIPLGLSLATAVRVGRAHGRGDPEGVARAGAVGIGSAVVVMAGTRAVVFLAVAGAFQLFDGLQVSAIGALRGLKDTRRPMVLALVAYWGIGLPSGIVLAFATPVGSVGLWYGLVLGLGSAGAFLLLRWRQALRREAAALRAAR